MLRGEGDFRDLSIVARHVVFGFALGMYTYGGEWQMLTIRSVFEFHVSIVSGWIAGNRWVTIMLILWTWWDLQFQLSAFHTLRGAS